ncbi:hypothetical protein BVG16_13425 [Paenibacillus selenitireducens]|uniref:Uncharacterized protein n=1 Tax=Paenibacillus selenitireducens TaxID=1324314 RepID=A0A1T2XCW6_9BACL|nr:hypothetical protein [Paenibacillus selenitireducens]OPA77453.1 hypothetical protein BVG16_13425 [Paenibacillus selenitireducens]
MDMNLIVNNTLAELKEEGYMEKVIRKHLEKTIEDVVEDSLRSWSDFGKKMKERIKEQMDFSLENLDIPSYNHLIMNVIKGELNRAMADEGTKMIQEQMQELLGTAKEEYKLSDLIKQMVEDDCELDELWYEDYKEITVIVEEKYGNQYIYIDPEEEKDWYECKYMIALNKDGTVWRSDVDKKNFENRVIMGGIYGLERMIFQMWTRKSKLIIDNYETSFTNPEYE